MADKSCPNCGRRITFGEFLRTMSLRFECCDCGIELCADRRHTMIASLIGAVPLALTISQALGDPIWWLGVAAAVGLFLLVQFRLLTVRRYRNDTVPDSPS